MRQETRRGRQEPTFETPVKYTYTDGPECAAMFKEYGYSLIPAQERELDVMLARDAEGKPAAITIGISRPRQNGKSYGGKLYSAWMAAVEGKNVLYSAHNGRTVRKFFKDLLVLFDSPDLYPDWAALVASVVKQKGEEGIYLHNGAYIEFSTRTNGGARGGSYSVVVIDEAQELTDAQLDALLPTVSATNDIPQTIYIGTPPNETCPGTVFRRIHDVAHSSAVTDTWWLEWSVDEFPPTSATRAQLLDLAYETNPMLGYRIKERVVLNEIEHMAHDGFARERLNWWSPEMDGYEHVVKKSSWAKCRTDHPLTVGKSAFGVKFSPDGKHFALAAARMDREDPDAPIHVELVMYESTASGTRALDEFLAQRHETASCFWADGKGRADNLVSRVLAMGAPRLYCHQCNLKDMVSAVSAFQDAVNAGSITHFDQEQLTESVTLSAKRRIGDKYSGGFGFGSVADVADSTAAEAAALAYQAVRTSFRDPGNEQVVMSW